MKSLYLILALAVGGTAFPAAATVDAVERVTAKEEVELSPVARVLSQANFLTKKKPNLKAQYFMFLQSMSWCVPCHIFCPKLLKDYSKMKAAKMELILLGREEEAVVKQYMKDRDFKCPGVIASQLGEIPGFDLSGFGAPAICIVTAEGEFVGKLGGRNMYGWRKMLRAYQAEQKKKMRAKKD